VEERKDSCVRRRREPGLNCNLEEPWWGDHAPCAPVCSVKPQSPSPETVSILVISGSALSSALHALSTARTNSCSSCARTRCLCSVARSGRTAEGEGATDGRAPDDHFQPGAEVFASSRRSITSDGGAAVGEGGGRTRRVSEKPGMFKLVCSTSE
jgi:hypothetical protein